MYTVGDLISNMTAMIHNEDRDMQFPRNLTAGNLILHHQHILNIDMCLC